MSTDFCINCKHSRERAISHPDGWSRNIKCFHARNLTDTISSVTGDTILHEYNTEVVRTAHCLGHWFEQKITALELRQEQTAIWNPAGPTEPIKSLAALKKISIDKL